MKKHNFNPKSFLSVIKTMTTEIKDTVQDIPAKQFIALAIKTTGVAKKDVLEYIKSLCSIPETPSDKEWTKILNYHIRWNGMLGKLIQNYKNQCKKISMEEFSIIATSCEFNANELVLENQIDHQYGWKKVLDALKDECKKIVDDTASDCSVEALPVVEKPKEENPGTPDEKSGKTIKTIVRKNASGEVVDEFKTSREAQDKTGFNKCSIRKSLNPENNPGYEHLKDKEGNVYTFEYKVEIVPVVKTPKRKYKRSKVIVYNILTGDTSLYDSVKNAADFIGVNEQVVYYRVKSNHKVNETFEVWREEEFPSRVGNAA